jgi:glycosyltransferase involved in cell wall biosynthesis
MNDIKFGIYTTFYNCERFVDSAFSSIESLNYDNFEWHITDDFSSDNTKKLILERLNKSTLKEKIKYFDQSEKKEMYWKPNLFFDDTFNWIILVDADDNFDEDFLILYDKILKDKNNINLISSDFVKRNESNNSLHSISYVTHNDNISEKIWNYHPKCDYLNNISYSCFGVLRGFKNVIPSFDVNDMLACAEDSYHVFWSNSFGKYLHVPRPLYLWNYREDSESHSKTVPHNFNANFNMALEKLKNSDFGVDYTYNDVYVETCSLGSFDIGKLKGKNVSLWTKTLSKHQKEKLQTLYFDCNLTFNNHESDIHIISLNFFNSNSLDSLLKKINGKKMLFYYQNQNYHFNNDEKDIELQEKLNYYRGVIENYTVYSWWTYIRHFIVRN